MKAIIIFITLCLISGQVLCFKVSGCTGGSLMFKCLYKSSRESDDQHKGAYFCKDDNCNTGIRTERQQRWVKNGRFFLYDDGNSRFITVFIINLSTEDQGEYTCGKKKKIHDVELEVDSESRCGTSVIQNGYIGQTISFRCEYEQEFKTLTKVVYRLKGGDPELMMNSSRSTPSPEEKILLSDSQRDHFTVTITSVSEDDNDGVYLCGVERLGSTQSSPTHTTFIKEIRLSISEKTSSDNSTENKSASVIAVIVAVSVGLILLTVCLALLLFKRKRSRKEDASPDRRETADTQEPASTGFYATIQSPQTQDSNPASTALYSAIQSPTVPSDGLMYAAVSFQKNEESTSDAKVTLNKDEIHCEYASVNHGITDN